MAERELINRKETEDAILKKVKPEVSERGKARSDVPDASVESQAGLMAGDARSLRSANSVQRAQLVQSLQRTRGNAYVQRLLNSSGIQAKLTVSSPDDEYEREADRVGDAVAKASASQMQRQPIEEEEEELQPKVQRQEEEEEELQPKVQRQEEEEEELQPKIQRQEEEEEELQPKIQRQEEEEEEELIQPKSFGDQTPEVSTDLETRINAARGSGESLPDSILDSFEPQFGRDFSDVSVHTNSEADELSQQINAQAFTTGSDIFFRSGSYQPESEEGKRLLGHEMTHVVQQGGASVARQAVESAEQAPSASQIETEKALEDARKNAWGNPIRENVRPLLYQAAVCQESGMKQVAQSALDSVAGKAVEMMKKEVGMLNLPTSSLRMAKDMLDQLVTLQPLDKENVEETEQIVMERLSKWAGEQMLISVELLKQVPTDDVAGLGVESTALVQMFGGDITQGIGALKKWAIEKSKVEEELEEAW